MCRMGRGVSRVIGCRGMYPPQYPPPYGYQPYPYMPPMPMRPQRSGVPRVVGILAIIFACVGLIGSAIWHFGPLSDVKRWHYQDQLSSVVTWMWIWMGLSVVVFVLHLVGGILAVQYKRVGLRLLTVYAIAALVLALADVVLCNALYPGGLEDHGYGQNGEMYFSVVTMRMVFSAMAAPWPVVALLLANGTRAKEACGTPSIKAADVF